MARIRGDGSSGKGAVMLSAHLDTVKAPKENWEEAGWKHDPFGAEIDEEDGCIYGRGTIDMKNMAAMSAAVLLFIARSGIKLTRDLIFAAVADEENVNSAYGAKYLLENHSDLIACDVVFTEVGGFTMFLNEKRCVPVMISEKGASTIRVTSRGMGGHGSTFHKHNPIAKISEVCLKVANNRLPHRVTNSCRVTFEGLAQFVPWPKSQAFKLLLSPRWHSWVLDYLLTEDQYKTLGPLLFNVSNPVIVHAGEAMNQIPSAAYVDLDTRTLPEVTSAEVEEELKNLIGRDKFEPRMKPDGSETPPELIMETLRCAPGFEQDPTDPHLAEVLEVIAKVVSDLDNGTPIIPNLLPGHTDCTFYMQLPSKPACFGFSPVFMPPGVPFASLFHGTNERIPVHGFKWGMAILMQTVTELCGGVEPKTAV